MPSRYRTSNPTPRLDYRQSTIIETPCDKPIPSTPCYDMKASNTTGITPDEPYCAAPLPKPSAVTNKKSSTHSNKNGDDVSDNYCTSSSIAADNCADTLSMTNDSHSLLLRKATSQSSMNLTTLIDNGAPLHHDHIIPRPTKSEPYSFTLIQPQEYPPEENNVDYEFNDDDWNKTNPLDSDYGGGTEKMDTTDHEESIWIKRKALQNRLLGIITKTIDQELQRNCPTAAISPQKQRQQQQLMTLVDDHSQFDKDDRSSDPSGEPSSSSPSPSVSQWWQQQHVALEKTITTQQQIFTTTMEQLKRRMDSLEQAQQEYILQQQQQQQQQQMKSQQSQDSQDEQKKYNALHIRYMDLVTQHSHQLEKYQQLEQAHLSQSNKLRSLELKQLHQQPQRSTFRHHQQQQPTATTILPSPPLNSVQKQCKTDDQQDISLDQQKKKRNIMDRQQHQHSFRQPHHQHHSNHSPNVTSSHTNAYNPHIQHQQKTRPYSSTPILPTPNASPTTTTTIIATSKEPSTSNVQLPANSSHQQQRQQQQQQQSFKMDDGYVEFMTECNGQPVLCRVKVPTKDAKVHDNNNNNNNNNRSSSAAPSFVTQSRQTNLNLRYHQHQHHTKGSNNAMTTRTHSPVAQKRYHPSSPSPPRHYRYHPRQGQYQQQQYQYDLSNQYQYQHPYKPYQSPLSTTNGKNLNPDAPVWTGSWQNSH